MLSLGRLLALKARKSKILDCKEFCIKVNNFPICCDPLAAVGKCDLQRFLLKESVAKLIKQKQITQNTQRKFESIIIFSQYKDGSFVIRFVLRVIH